MPDFDPFTATHEEALAHGESWAVSAWEGARKLTDDREYYLANPMIGMSVCAQRRLVAPDWLAKAYVAGVNAVWNFDVRSWNEAFKSPHPKGKHKKPVDDMEYQRRAAIAVEAVLIKDPNRPINNDFWDDIGALIGMDQLIDVDQLNDVNRHRGLKRTKAMAYHKAAVEDHQALPADVFRNRLLGLPDTKKFKKLPVRRKPHR